MKKAARGAGFGTVAAYSGVIGQQPSPAAVPYLKAYWADTNTARSGAGSAENVGKPVKTP